jgi:hypothetical protein
MPEYVLGHHLKGEGQRLALMSELLDPLHRRYLQSRDVVRSGATTLEVGCGNGSISAWLAGQIPPDGQAIAVDLDLSLVDVRLPNLELRKADIMAGPVGLGVLTLSRLVQCFTMLPTPKRRSRISLQACGLEVPSS